MDASADISRPGRSQDGLLEASIAWRRLDVRGRETAVLRRLSDGWQLTGRATFDQQGADADLEYLVECDARWKTRACRVRGGLGGRQIQIEITVDEQRRWHLNGAGCPTVDGCIDIDLNFSPSTNLLPVRRLGLGVAEGHHVIAAWLRFPSFALEPLEQRYTRLDDHTYRYESAGGTFVRDLSVNDVGFVTHYPGLWEEA